jgi:hypothetical protein
MFELSFLRHGHKVEAGTERSSLEESGLTPEQQEKWKEALSVLNEGVDPEITYENIPLIEDMASDIFSKLPEKALLLFTSTDYPRTRMTSALLSQELIRISQSQAEKDIAVASIWEPKETREQEDSVSNLPNENREAVALFREFQKSLDLEKDPALQEYFNHPTGGKNHSKGQEMLFEIANKDLASENSVFRKAAEQMKGQIESFKEKYKDADRPIYFFGVGHNTTFVALDVAVNGRDHYDSVDEIVEPLTLWKVTG